MKLLLTAFLSSGVFFLVYSIVCFIAASKQSGHDAALKFIEPGAGAFAISFFLFLVSKSLWKNSGSITTI